MPMSMPMSTVLEASALRAAFGTFPTGVTALAATVDGVPAGMAASSFTSVSLNPPLVSVCIATSSETWPTLRRAPAIGGSVLASVQMATSRQLAAKGTDRFAGLEWEATPAGAVFLTGSVAWLDCAIEREITAGDHEIVLLRIARLGSDPAATPLVFHSSGFHRLTPMQAPMPPGDALL